MKRILAGVAVAALLGQGCNSYTVMATGAVGMVAGGVMLAEANEGPDCDGPDTLACGIGGAFTVAASVGFAYAILLGSGAVFAGGVLGAVYEAGAPARRVEPKDARAANVVSFEGETSAGTVLAMHIRIAARGNRCQAAYVMANRLAAQDPRLVAALIKGDEQVARCMAADWAAEVEPAEPPDDAALGGPMAPGPAAPAAAAPPQTREPTERALRPD